MNLSVVMITLNEEESIKIVVEDIKKYAPDSEILIVDSSSDRTPEIAESMGVKVIKQYPPEGYGPAMETALRSAKGDVVVTLDCDNTYPVDRIPEMAKYILSGKYDIVEASRLKKKPKAMPIINFVGNWGLALIASLVFYIRLKDLHSGMRAYSKKLINELNFNANGPALPVELLLAPIRLKKELKVIFIDYYIRIGDTKMVTPFRDTWWTLKRIFKCRFSNIDNLVLINTQDNG